MKTIEGRLGKLFVPTTKINSSVAQHATMAITLLRYIQRLDPTPSHAPADVLLLRQSHCRLSIKSVKIMRHYLHGRSLNYIFLDIPRGCHWWGWRLHRGRPLPHRLTSSAILEVSPGIALLPWKHGMKVNPLPICTSDNNLSKLLWRFCNEPSIGQRED